MKEFTVLLLFTLSLATANELKKFASGNRQFTADLYTQLIKKNENFLVSPLSIQTVLAVAQSGAKNETGDEIRTVLHLPSSKQEVEAVYKILHPRIKGRKTCALFSANKIYIAKTFPIKDEFVKVAKEVYQCSVENINFVDKSRAAKSINNWVEKKTKNKIHDLVSEDSFDKDTVAVLINALYFKGEWTKTFKTRLTEKKDFFKTPEETVQVEMMHNTDQYELYESEELDAKFLKLSFKHSRKVQMVLVLPNKKDGLTTLENQVDKVFGNPKFELQRVKLLLPKFRIDTSINVKDILQELGVVKAFQDADFSGISKKGQIYISDILQKTFINIDEKGIEAAAATSVQFQSRSFPFSMGPHKYFIADHPFLFYIKIKNAIIFAGRIVSPV